MLRTIVKNELGRQLQDGEVLFHQGDLASYMYIVQEGFVELYQTDPDFGEIQIDILQAGDIVGAVSVFHRSRRTSSARAQKYARVLTINLRSLIRRIQDDPSIALKIFEKLSHRIVSLNSMVASHKLLFRPTLHDTIIADDTKSIQEPFSKKWLLIAFIIGIAALVAAFVVSLHIINADKGSRNALYNDQIITHYLLTFQEQETTTMEGLIKFLVMNTTVQERFQAQNRQGLLDAVQPIFLNILQKQAITHFNFINPNQKLFLRVHKPELYDDIVERTTLKRSQRDLKTVSGLELGRTGSLTLRTLVPWRDQDRILGYVELGKNFYALLDRIHALTKMDFLFFLEKKYLQLENWHKDTQTPNHFGEWESFPAHFLASSTLPSMPKAVAAYLTLTDNLTNPKPTNIQQDQRFIHLNHIPIRDIDGRQVGHILAIQDETWFQGPMQQQQNTFLMISMAICGLFFLAIHWLLNKIQKQTNQVIKELRERKQQYRTQLENLGNQLFVLSIHPPGNISYISPSITYVLGYQQAECVTHFSKYLTPGMKNRRSLAKARSAIKQRKPTTIELEAFNKKGYNVRLNIDIVPVFDDNNRLNSVECIVQEVTNQKAPEENRRMLEQHGDMLYALIQTTTQPLPLVSILERVLDLILSLSSLTIHSKGAVFLVKKDEACLVLAAQRGLEPVLLEACAKIQFGQCLCGKTAVSCQPVFAAHIDEDHDISFPNMQPHGHYCIPILHGRELLGVMTFYLAAGHAKNREEIHFLVSVANTLALLIKNKERHAASGLLE